MKKPKIINIDSINIDNTYLELHNRGWRNEELISLRDILKILDKNIDTVSNVNMVEIKDEDSSINSSHKDNNINISIDKNYLYVWIKEEKKWKRIPLSNF